MFKIGDFSKLSQISIKALRLYDRMGLLKPFHIDPYTNYRYYSAKQLPRLNRILAFKDLGFSLEQIRKLLEDDIPLEQIRGMLRLKQAELQKQIESEQLKLNRVKARIKQIEEENTMRNYDVVVKKVEPIKVASIREILPNYSAVGELFNELIGYLQQYKITKFDYCAAIWHDQEYKESDVDGEAVLVIDTALAETDRIKVYELPRYDEIACIIHQGSYLTLNQSYENLLAWIETNGYQIIAPNRELYIQGGQEQDNESYITEIQFPVQKV
ncbi:MerR family transcriptional regulator [Pleurocapsa sp. PCC 7319]|uniref:MerR family transcriptional regulator n=1 Tax=Pleurocapsa sp. PCC 7319 TaxID=118161 RepID=UPI00034BC5AC|nr:MerR family transcriptional regulator [Pleurocapsa sp. PCC 7319]